MANQGKRGRPPATGKVAGTCRICGQQGPLDKHHIISQAQCNKNGRRDLLSNPGNITYICRSCHDMTTASIVRKILERTEKIQYEAICYRCGRNNHMAPRCKARTTFEGEKIPTGAPRNFWLAGSMSWD